MNRRDEVKRFLPPTVIKNCDDKPASSHERDPLRFENSIPELRFGIKFHNSTKAHNEPSKHRVFSMTTLGFLCSHPISSWAGTKKTKTMRRAENITFVLNSNQHDNEKIRPAKGENFVVERMREQRISRNLFSYAQIMDVISELASERLLLFIALCYSIYSINFFSRNLSETALTKESFCSNSHTESSLNKYWDCGI